MPARPRSHHPSPLRFLLRAAVLAGACTMLFGQNQAFADERLSATPIGAAYHFHRIPEPSTLLSIVGGAALLIGWRRWQAR